MEIERWKTVSRQDPEFPSYLDGSFSRELRALPVRSLNVGLSSERVTFEIVPLKEIARPRLARVACLLIRPRTLVLSLGPMAATVAECLVRGSKINIGVALSSFLGVMCFHIAANLFNDYGDHIRGRDRLRPTGGTRVLQNGWVSAAAVNRAAWVLMLAAAVCGGPAIYLHLAPVAIMAGLAGLAGLEFAFQRLRLKARGWSEVMAFALTGPLLTGAFAWATTGAASLADFVLGGVFGALSLMYFHSANFENIMTDSQAGIRTWATRTGFDASKRFFNFTAILLLAFAAVAGIFFSVMPSMPVIVGVLAVQMFLLCRRVAALASPLASDLTGLRWSVLTVAWTTTALFVFGAVWTLLRT